MDTYSFGPIEERLVYQQLANGLQIYIVPKVHYHTVHGVLSVGFGSAHSHLRNGKTNEEIVVPAGAAHFLEHKLFEDAQGEDVSQRFANQGATINAFTSHTQTNYFFAAPVNVKDNVLTLLDFVQQANFTPESVNREKGIIQQEWLMYEDDPYAKGYQCLLRNLYPNNPVSDDILGTLQTIEAMTFEDLQLCFETFYQPNNMRLIIVGNVEPESLIECIMAHELYRECVPSKWSSVLPTVWEPTIQEETLYLDVSQSVVMLGVRLLPLEASDTGLASDWLVDILVEMLFGPMSNNYAKWYQSQLLDTSFTMNTVATPLMHHLTLEATTNSPDELLAMWQKVLTKWNEQPDLNEEHFEAVIRGRIGDFLRALDDLEGMATELTECLQYGHTHLEALEFLKNLTYAEVTAYAEKYLAQLSMSKVTILPLNV